MAEKQREYRHGRIIGAYLRTRKGPKELHPAVIISPDEEITQPEDFDPRSGGENFVIVVGVSTKYTLYNDPYLKLPYASPFHPQTRLNKDAAAIIGWYDIVHIDDECQFKAGDVPPPLMIRLNQMIREDITKRIGREFRELAEIVPLLFPSE